MALTSWTEPATTWLTSSRKAQLVLTAVTAGAVVGGSILSFQALRRDKEISDLKSSIPPPQQDPIANKISQYGDAHRPHLVANPTTEPISKEDAWNAARAARARKGDYDEDLILEQLARNRVFLTDPGLTALRSAFVVVIGLGGVGSHCASALARSGVSKLRLVDFDQVTLSSLNRHAVATLADVGTPKVTTMRTRLEQITPWTQFDLRNELFSAAAAPSHLGPWAPTGQKPDFVVDAIDNIDSKVDLLLYCHTHGIPVISSMGAGCKSDPTRVFVGDISTSTEDPLSRATRRRLRIAGVASGIPVVFSTEKPGPGKARLLPLPEEEFERGKVGELGVLPDFRVRILPVLGTMPAVFGLCVANYVICRVGGYPMETGLVKGREKMYDALLAGLQGMEERLARGAGGDALGLRVAVSQEDVAYLVEEVFRGKSVVSGLSTRLALVRWRWPEGKGAEFDASLPGQKLARLTLNEVVCMTKEEAAKHEKEVLKEGKSPEEVWGSDVVDRVRIKKEEEDTFSLFR